MTLNRLQVGKCIAAASINVICERLQHANRMLMDAICSHRAAATVLLSPYTCNTCRVRHEMDQHRIASTVIVFFIACQHFKNPCDAAEHTKDAGFHGMVWNGTGITQLCMYQWCSQFYAYYMNFILPMCLHRHVMQSILQICTLKNQYARMQMQMQMKRQRH